MANEVWGGLDGNSLPNPSWMQMSKSTPLITHALNLIACSLENMHTQADPLPTHAH